MTNETDSSLRNLERDAELNRAALLQTVDALQQRISPSAIRNGVEDYVREKKDGLLDRLQQSARDNPVQTVAIAAGAAYPLWGIASRIPIPLLLIGAGLALSRRSGNGNDRGYAEGISNQLGTAAGAARQKFDAVSGVVRDQVRGGMESARSAAATVSEAVGTVSDYAAQASGTATDALRGIGQDATSMAADTLSPERIRHASDEASDWINATISRNPLLVGALGLAVGAVIAAALPSTSQENRILGSAADGLKRRASEAALDGVEAAKGIATELYQEASDRAAEQGLSADSASELAGTVGEKLKAVVTSVTSGEPGNAGDERNIQPDRFPASPVSGG